MILNKFDVDVGFLHDWEICDSIENTVNTV